MSSIHLSKECVIHVHGAVHQLDIDDLIFTKEDYNKLILKHFSGFSFALRALFTRYSTLFVGYGASDPHLEEVMEEVADYFPTEDMDKFPLPVSYLVTRRDKADCIFEKWKGRVRTSLIVVDDYDGCLTLLKELQKNCPSS